METDKRIANLREKIDDWFESAVHTGGWDQEQPFELPITGIRSTPIDIIENTKEFRISVELPGINKEEIQVNICEGGFEVHAKHNKEYEKKDEQVYRIERSQKDYYRFIRLPTSANLEKAEAKLREGILHIHVPKNTLVTKKSQVEVK